MRPAAGLAFKTQHFAKAVAEPVSDLWFEVHAEDYMFSTGSRLAMLERLRCERPLSLHGVSMSLAGAAAPDRNHLAALKRLVVRVEPALVSEHLSWSRLEARCFPDLLPVPRTNEILRRLAANIGLVQDTLGREILIENPTHYFALAEHQWSETSFLSELARRSGCKLLIDINNVAVSAHNLRFEAATWLESIPAKLVGEIHLAGHRINQDGSLLIDAHDAPISDDVWQLFESFIARIGPAPTLIERDGRIPRFGDLLAERQRAESILLGSISLAA